MLLAWQCSGSPLVKAIRAIQQRSFAFDKTRKTKSEVMFVAVEITKF